MGNEKYNVSTVSKALKIFELLSEKETTASEISRMLDLNKSTAHRLLYTLQEAGFIEKDEETRKYRIGIKMVEICSLRINDIEIKTEARPFLQDLVKSISQPVHLGIYSGGKAVFIDKIDVYSTIRIYSQIGKTIPVYCSAIGKALILERPDEEIREIAKKCGMKKITPNTITEVEELVCEIHNSRERGYTVDRGEHEENVYCLAVPIYDYRKKIIAAISVAVQKNKLENAETLVKELKKTAKNISKSLGY